MDDARLIPSARNSKGAAANLSASRPSSCGPPAHSPERRGQTSLGSPLTQAGGRPALPPAAQPAPAPAPAWLQERGAQGCSPASGAEPRSTGPAPSSETSPRGGRRAPGGGQGTSPRAQTPTPDVHERGSPGRKLSQAPRKFFLPPALRPPALERSPPAGLPAGDGTRGRGVDGGDKLVRGRRQGAGARAGTRRHARLCTRAQGRGAHAERGPRGPRAARGGAAPGGQGRLGAGTRAVTATGAESSSAAGTGAARRSGDRARRPRRHLSRLPPGGGGRGWAAGGGAGPRVRPARPPRAPPRRPRPAAPGGLARPEQPRCGRTRHTHARTPRAHTRRTDTHAGATQAPGRPLRNHTRGHRVHTQGTQMDTQTHATRIKRNTERLGHRHTPHTADTHQKLGAVGGLLHNFQGGGGPGQKGRPGPRDPPPGGHTKPQGQGTGQGRSEHPWVQLSTRQVWGWGGGSWTRA